MGADFLESRARNPYLDAKFPEAKKFSLLHSIQRARDITIMPPRLRAACQLSAPLKVFRGGNGSGSSSDCLFSTSSALETRQRRVMYDWLRNQGANFETPLPNSTNYLGAYNNQGVLRRLNATSSEKDGPENSNKETSGRTKSKQPGPQADVKQAIPSETRNDLMPFPLNKYFRSQPVVDEPMREDIWTRIMKDGQSVRTVSAELGVEMSRVGAIVRLKEVEKEWIRKVSSNPTNILPHQKYYDETTKSISL